jgi:AcrR family transcriptional regulator
MVYIFEKSGEHSAAVSLNRSRKMREIMSVALKLACDGGMDNLTLHRLADRMDRSVAAVYRYFPSREAVISELQRVIATHIALITTDAQTRVEEWARAENKSESDIALAKILVATFAYNEFAKETPNELGLVTRYLTSPDHVLPERDAAHVFERTESSLDALADLITSAEQLGALSQGAARDRAIMLWAGLQGTINILKIVRRGGWSPHPDLTQQMVITTLVGCGADEATLNQLTKTIIEKKMMRIERVTQDLLMEPENL